MKSHLKTEKTINKLAVGFEPVNAAQMTKATKTELPPQTYKNTDFVTVVPIGTVANVYDYGYAGGQKTLLWADKDLNTVTNFHRMGGTLDPGADLGDLGCDISVDGGTTWTNMIEVYISVDNQGAKWYADTDRYTNHGIYDPPGNMDDPNKAYLTFFAPELDHTNDIWGDYCYGRSKIGDIEDTTRHLEASRPGEGVMLHILDEFTITRPGDTWVTDINQD